MLNATFSVSTRKRVAGSKPWGLSHRRTMSWSRVARTPGALATEDSAPAPVGEADGVLHAASITSPSTGESHEIAGPHRAVRRRRFRIASPPPASTEQKRDAGR